MKILITGANRGLGLELTRQLLEKGYQVAAGVRNTEGNETVSRLSDRYPGQLHQVVLDLADEQSIRDAAMRLTSAWGCLDVLVNNAGILMGRDKNPGELELADLEHSFQVNAFGPMLTVKHFLPLLKKGDSSMIINITSEAANDLSPFDMPYSMSKAALNMYSIKLNSYVRKNGMRVLAMHPGWIRTDMGGSSAPNPPSVPAMAITACIEGSMDLPSDAVIIDYTGKSL